MEDNTELQEVIFKDLTENRFQEALTVIEISGWDKNFLACAREEMLASIRGSIDGYIHSQFILAICGDKVVGVSAWAPAMCSFAIYELSWATVLPEWRHRGINSGMLAERLKKIRQFHGPEPFEVIVYTWDNPLYARTGFLACHAQNIDPEKKRLLLARFPRMEG